MIWLNTNSISLVALEGQGNLLYSKKLHAACRKHGILITICAQSSRAALTFDGATLAHSLFFVPSGRWKWYRRSEPSNMQFQQRTLQLSLWGFSYILGLIYFKWPHTYWSCLAGIQNKMECTTFLRVGLCWWLCSGMYLFENQFVIIQSNSLNAGKTTDSSNCYG